MIFKMSKTPYIALYNMALESVQLINYVANY